MGEVHHLKPPRTLAHIVAEILLDQGRISHLRGTAADEVAWGLLEGRISANREEARAMIAKLTGVDWEDLEGALV